MSFCHDLGLQACFHPHISPPVGRVNLKWEKEHEDRLLNILRDLLKEGIRPPYEKCIIPLIAQSLNNQLNDGTQYTDYQFGEKICRIREAYASYIALKTDNNGTGFG
jgi:hypothetical protein